MYSLILMTAMASAPETPEFFGIFRDRRTGSCSGSCHGSCDGYGSGSETSCGCYGSDQDRTFGWRLRAFFHRDGSCHGDSCHGYCTGKTAGGYGSCSGKGNSCTGYAAASCHGGGCTGKYPPNGMPPSGGFDPGYATPSPAVGYAPPPSACESCSLGVPTPVGVPYGAMPMAPPRIEAMPSPARPDVVPEDRNARRAYLPQVLPAGASTNRATVIVRLPADAKLYAEGKALALTSAERSFVTPPLPAGQTFTYEFRAEYVRSGETISSTKQVQVKAGGTVSLAFTDLTAAKVSDASPTLTVAPPTVMPTVALPTAAAKTVTPPAPPAPPTSERARITVKLPPGAALFVDGKKNEGTEAIREFGTPPLPPGQEFAYLMKAETIKDGRPESQTTKVTFRAGEIVTVDFTAK